MAKTLVIGASRNPERYSYRAVLKLRTFGHEVVAFNLTKGNIADVEITNEWPYNESIDTVSLYINPLNQEEYYEKMIQLGPRRVIFNPGSENEEFEFILTEAGIRVERACTLVLLSIGNY